MKHLILGTAGHVDHGKTALIKALTGIDCDTHKEEKRRGVTIHLGFSYLNLPRGERMGIVDVPGHRDFIHTMVGGASGIDIVLLVIAADSGIMPQTREHLQIMDVLGLRQGLVVLTRIDLVDDPEMIELIKDEVKEFVKDTFLEDKPIVEVSSKTGNGIDQLKKSIENLAATTQARPTDGVFRMPVDRIFSKSGFGTVVGGSVFSGSIGVEDKVYLLPGGAKELRVRHLQRYGETVERVVAGDRAALNLVGLDKSDFKRGMVISDHLLDGKRMVDAKLQLFNQDMDLGIWSQVIFHSGTYEDQAKIHLIDTDKLGAGESALVQIHFTEPCVLKLGDRYVIRNSSSDTTLGGGEVIDVAPLHHRKRPQRLIDDMQSQANAKFKEAIAAQVRKFHRPVYAEDLARVLNVSATEVTTALAKKLPADIILFNTNKQLILVPRDARDAMLEDVVQALDAFTKANPFIGRGANFDEIRGALKIGADTAAAPYLHHILKSLASKGAIAEHQKTWSLVGGSKGDGKQRSDVDAIEQYFIDQGMNTPIANDLKEICNERKLSDKDLKQILATLTSAKKLYRVQEYHLHATIVDDCRKKLVAALQQSKQKSNEGITVAAFRDLVGGNRKLCLLLLTIYDGERVTRRDGDVRYLET